MVTLGPFATNCYVVHAPPSKDCWVVDASFEPGALVERVRRLELTPRLVILTHAHIDHIAGLDEVRRAFAKEKPRVLIHEAEARFLEDPMLNLSGLYGAPFSTGPADGTLRGGETLELGATRWRVLFTPGHSPGGITLVCDAARVALVGDTLFAGSIGRFDFPTSDEAALYRSIREDLYALPDETKVYPGHGPPTTIGREKRTNPYVRAQ
jgi:glyoxylase-like metal-dependent hydrolase (beta-lactamase superfamily II)